VCDREVVVYAFRDEAAPFDRTLEPSCRIVAAGATDVGRQREKNEDRFGVFPELGLFVVADGMGGAAAGEVAAEMTVELLREAFTDPSTVSAHSPEPIQRAGAPLLAAAVHHANASTFAAAQRDLTKRGMGTTVVALAALGDRVAIAHVGDSRAYRLRDGRLDLLTEDHSLCAEMIRRGLMTPEEAEESDLSNIISRAVGNASSVEVETQLRDLHPGDVFLLCSDGLSKVVEHREIEHILRVCPQLDEAAARLIAFANGRGGPDNITVVMVRNEVAGGSRPLTPARPR
jgi:serine/threonine protein phosphatase PrpC